MAFFKKRKPTHEAPPPKKVFPLEPKTYTPDEALAKTEHFCAYRERCPKEVREKIRELGIEGETAEQIYQVLQEDGFFNEERFAYAYAGGKFRVNEWGKVRIRLELKMRDIAPKFIQAALNDISDEAYEAMLHKLRDRKLAQFAGEDAFSARQKTAAYLIRTGFEPELVFEALRP